MSNQNISAPNIYARELLTVMQECVERWPNATLVRSSVGNLNIIVDDMWVGIIEVMHDELFVLDEPEPIDDDFAWAWYRR